jgi:hypothetical protein
MDTYNVAQSREKASKVTAWMLDQSVAVADDGAHIPGIPGLWKPGEAVAPEAFGMGVQEFATIVDQLGLPLIKVSVAEGEARTAFERPDTQLPSAPLGAAVTVAAEPEALVEEVEEG